MHKMQNIFYNEYHLWILYKLGTMKLSKINKYSKVLLVRNRAHVINIDFCIYLVKRRAIS